MPSVARFSIAPVRSLGLEHPTEIDVTELDDAARLIRINGELDTGFDALGHVGRAVSVFGSARTPRWKFDVA